ncbi:MAG: hypothetical protein FJZ96_01065 [Chloroflexi bacterium]|nr:hypothetical protein [Chloroflexota bacterium]
MTWQQLEKRIRSEIQPGHRGILKCRGNDRRSIIANNGNEISIRTGVKTDNAKSVTYEMIKYAYDIITCGKIFDSTYYQNRYSKEYRDGQCRYSIVGGILVEMGEAERIPSGTNSCLYRKNLPDNNAGGPSINRSAKE